MSIPAILTVGNEANQFVLTSTRVETADPYNHTYGVQYTRTQSDGTVTEHDLGPAETGLPYDIVRLAERQGLSVKTLKERDQREMMVRTSQRESTQNDIRTSIIEWARETDQDRDNINYLLGHLNMEEWSNKWDVTVEYGWGQSFTVFSVEAETEEEAIESVTEGLTVTVNTTIEYEGGEDSDGSIDTDEDDTSWVFENLTITAVASE